MKKIYKKPANQTIIVFMAVMLLFFSCIDKNTNKSTKNCSNEATVSLEKDTINLEKTNIDIINNEVNSDSVYLRLNKFCNKLYNKHFTQDSFVDYSNTSIYKNKYCDLFLKDDIKKMIGYGHYVKSEYKVLNYDKLTLFVFEYNSTKAAIIAFEKFESEATYIYENIEKHHTQSNFNIRQDAFDLALFAKSGGLVFQKGPFIITLVKRCGGNGLSLSWKEYETIFMKIVLDESDSGITLYNANCGDWRYTKQKFKAH